MNDVGRADSQRFQVDLQGMIELLSAHLYSGPEVVVRELIQNGVDACAMRAGGPDPHRPAVRLVPSKNHLDCLDSGCGLRRDDVDEFLATVGRSAKRDELGMARHDTLGQFGIGILSGFLIADTIHMVSRHQSGDGVVTWLARSDGTYEAAQFSDVDQWEAAGGDRDRADWLRQGSGTVVRLSPRRDALTWTHPDTVRRLAAAYAGFVRSEIEVVSGSTQTAIAPTPAPWDMNAAARASWAHEQWRTPILASMPVSVPDVGAKAALFVLDAPVSPSLPAEHRVYVKGMKVVDGDAPVLPRWAFFVRAVVDADLLHPTASREALRRDDALDSLREHLGRAVTSWLQRTAATDPDLFGRFLARHEIGLTAMASEAGEADFPALAELVPFETSRGHLTLGQIFRDAPDGVEWVRTLGEFQQVLPVAEAEGAFVVNGGYVYCSQLLERCARHERWRGKLRRTTPRSLRDRMRDLDPDRAAMARVLELAARRHLRELGVRISVRRFEPRSVPAVLLDDPASATARASQDAADDADELLAGLISMATAHADPRPELVLNDNNDLVRRLVGVDDDRILKPVLQSLYARALLLGRHRTTQADQRTIDYAFAGLLSLALGEPA